MGKSRCAVDARYMWHREPLAASQLRSGGELADGIDQILLPLRGGDKGHVTPQLSPMTWPISTPGNVSR
jgi:hypothetical protein